MGHLAPIPSVVIFRPHLSIRSIFLIHPTGAPSIGVNDRRRRADNRAGGGGVASPTRRQRFISLQARGTMEVRRDFSTGKAARYLLFASPPHPATLLRWIADPSTDTSYLITGHKSLPGGGKMGGGSWTRPFSRYQISPGKPR